MGTRIQELPPSVVSKIAAGEMIARPAAMVKELVENSLDAQSTSIGILVRERLDRYVEVVDDGEGIPRDELALALRRHATSKIRAEEELDHLVTLGFRGEALPSIARISRLTLTSRVRGSGEAWRVRASGDGVESPEPAGRAPGTTVVVEDLFFNAPVRKRSLKAPSSELRLARRILEQYALLSLPVRWSLTVNDRAVLDLPPAPSLEERLRRLFGAETVDAVVPIQYEGALGDAGALRLEGFLGAPERARPSPQQQMHFANGRAIVSGTLIQALRQGYGDLIPAGRHPWAVLFVTVEPAALDVNVHPTKREVRFLHENTLFSEVQRAVRQAATAFRPGLSWSSGEGVGGAGAPGGGASTAREPFLAGVRSGDPDGLTAARALYGPSPNPEAGEGISPAGDRAEAPLWQLGRRYIVHPKPGALLIVDQHAAHERILYERALGRWGSEKLPSQKLLFPETVEVGEAEIEVFEGLAPDMERLGFEVELFGERALIVHAVPSLTGRDIAPSLVGEMLQEVVSAHARAGESLELLAKAFACRCAVKSGQDLGREEMAHLLRDLFATEVPHGDPHGRPTYVEMRVDDLDRRFGRH